MPLLSLVFELLSPNVWSIWANVGDASRCRRTARIICSETSRGLHENVWLTILLRVSVDLAKKGSGAVYKIRILTSLVVFKWVIKD
jgi:hypothetical protein